jgi:hypothetical protein
MTPEQVALVQTSFAKVAPVADQAAQIFYDRLFAVAPQVRSLFPNDMTEQRRKLMATLAVVVNGLDKRRWGQIPEYKSDSWYAETATQVYRPDIYLKAAKQLIAEGKAKQEDFPWDSDGYRAPTNEFIDDLTYDARKPNDYLESLAIGLKQDQQVDGAKIVSK